MRLSRRRLNLASTAAALPALAFAFCAVLACRNLDDLVLVPVRDRVLAAGGASRLDVARARSSVPSWGIIYRDWRYLLLFLLLFHCWTYHWWIVAW